MLPDDDDVFESEVTHTHTHIWLQPQHREGKIQFTFTCTYNYILCVFILTDFKVNLFFKVPICTLDYIKHVILFINLLLLRIQRILKLIQYEHLRKT